MTLPHPASLPDRASAGLTPIARRVGRSARHARNGPQSPDSSRDAACGGNA